jgi:hypothetical protein
MEESGVWRGPNKTIRRPRRSARRSVAECSATGLRATVDDGAGPIPKEVRGAQRQDRQP